MVNKRLINTGAEAAPAGLDPLQNFETVTYTGNGSTQKITGYIRKGAAFNGSSSKIDLPNSLDLATGNNNFTVSFWVNTNDTSNDEIYISLLRNYFFYVRKFSTNEIYIELGNSDSVNTGVSLTQNTWTHIAVTKSSSTGLILYKGGTAVATYSSKTGNIAAGGDPNQIGIYNNSSSYAVDGKIDQVRLFNTALNPTQVGELALETYADPKKSTTDYFGNGSGVALYELDEDAKDTGDTYNGTPTNVNFLGMAFQPDLVWVKVRDASTSHALIDSVRGRSSVIYTNLPNGEATSSASNDIVSFDSNGFTLGADQQTNANTDGNPHVAWCFNAGGNSNTFNVDGIGYSSASAAGLATGTNNPTGASVNTKSGFSIIKLNSGSVANSDRTVAHGLGVKPSFVLFRRTSLSAWFTWSAGLSPESYYLYLQESYGVNDLTQSSNAWGNQSFTDTTISWRNSWTFSPNEELIAYVWADIPGYQKSGSYTGNDSSKRIYTDSNADGTGTGGFAPRFLLIKCSSNGGTNKEWNIFDTTRDPSPINKRLEANTSDSEFIDTSNITINSDGFTLGDNGTATGSINQVGFDYIYLAIA